MEEDWQGSAESGRDVGLPLQNAVFMPLPRLAGSDPASARSGKRFHRSLVLVPAPAVGNPGIHQQTSKPGLLVLVLVLAQAMAEASGEIVCEEDDLFEAGLSSITARHPFAALFCSSLPRGITVYQAPGV